MEEIHTAMFTISLSESLLDFKLSQNVNYTIPIAMRWKTEYY